MDNELTPDQQLLVTDNLSLVPYLFQKLPKSDLTRTYESELISEGYLGLVIAAKKYDPNKGIKFSSYSGTVIRNAMLMEIRRLNRDYTRTTPLDASIGSDKDGNELSLIDILEGDNNIQDYMDDSDTQDTISVIRQIIDNEGFSDKQLKILKLRLSGMKRTEIIKELGISNSYISRILSTITSKIRSKLKELEDDTKSYNAIMNKRVPDPNSPKLSDYNGDKSLWTSDYQRYRYLKVRGRESEFIPTIPPIKNESSDTQSVIDPPPIQHCNGPTVANVSSQTISDKVLSNVSKDVIIKYLTDAEKKLEMELKAIRITKSTILNMD